MEKHTIITVFKQRNPHIFFPSDGTVHDPVTFKQIPPPEFAKRAKSTMFKGKFDLSSAQNESKLSESSPLFPPSEDIIPKSESKPQEEKSNSNERAGRGRSTSFIQRSLAVESQDNKYPVPPKEGKPLHLKVKHFDKNELMKEVQNFQTPEYARKFFKTHRTGSIFNRKVVPLENMINFSPNIITEPLLATFPIKSSKIAIQSFQLILQYSGVLPDKSAKMCVNSLIQNLLSLSPLRDEVYFQLIKQTRSNPNPEWLLKTWRLFCIIATIFPSTRDSEKYISSHFVLSFNEENQEISDLAQFTYIRFNSRCSIGKPLEISNFSGDASELYTLVYSETSPFVGSLNEFMWYQRNLYPSLPIPIILIEFTKSIIDKNGLQSPGLFRLPGSLKKIDGIIQKNVFSQDILDDCSINDIASLMKRWFRELSTCTIPDSYLPQFEEAVLNSNFNEFVESLPQVNKYTLLYLIGFLQLCFKNVEYTKMNSDALATVFAPNIAGTQENDTMIVSRINAQAKDFIIQMIHHFDAAEYYPLDQKYFEK